MTEVLLIALNIFQFLFWGWQCQKLVDKLMCKDLAEYKQITEPPKPPVIKEEDPAEIFEEQSILNELNGQLRSA